jgi:hypothetical protein
MHSMLPIFHFMTILDIQAVHAHTSKICINTISAQKKNDLRTHFLHKLPIFLVKPNIFYNILITPATWHQRRDTFWICDKNIL